MPPFDKFSSRRQNDRNDDNRDFNRPRRDGPPRRSAPGGYLRGKAKASPPPEGSEHWATPWVQIKYPSRHPCVWSNMVKGASPDARPGDLVTLYDRDGVLFGFGLYSPGARIPVRVMEWGSPAPGEEWFTHMLRQAADLRRNILHLDQVTDSYRVFHGDADGIGGLIVDRFGPVLSIEVSNIGAARRIQQWIPILHEALGTRTARVMADATIAKMEGIDMGALQRASDLRDRTVKITEHGIRYEVDFSTGHKTGFFCDQRENRLKLTDFTEGRNVLDLCCYTGGFSLAAKMRGRARRVVGVDLDEKSIAQAKRNANLNEARIEFTHADAFVYARQMQRNDTHFGTVVLDPPKFVLGREEIEEGRKKYFDLNRLALSLVEPGGFFVTCSCSGLLSAEDFETTVSAAAHSIRARLQILDRTGAGPDHPGASHHPESRYLKVLWCRKL